MAGALNNNASALLNDVDNVVRTGLSADSTTDTLGRIDVSNAVLGIDADCILRTYCDTVAVTKACEGTSGITCVAHISSRTGLNAVVNELSVFGKAGAVTTNVSDLSLYVACCKTHDLGNLSSNISATGSTKTGVVGFTLTESLCIAVTTGETTSTAVCTGEAITNCKNTLILFNCKECSSKSKKNSTSNSDNSNYNYSFYHN